MEDVRQIARLMGKATSQKPVLQGLLKYIENIKLALPAGEFENLENSKLSLGVERTKILQAYSATDYRP